MNPSIFILVHGGFHGSWCWERLLPLLRRHGHQAEAVDLPYPDDPDTDSAALLTGWATQVVQRARAYDSPVILVGHSRGGLVISQAAELAPGCFSRLVYCAAILANDGETAADVRQRLGEDGVAALTIHTNRDVGTAIAEPASAASAIYSGCTPADAAWAVARLRPETMAGLGIAPRLTAERYGGVPRAAIECTHDRILSPAFQRAMRESLPCDIVTTLECDHAPYLSDPVGLCAALDRIASAR